MGSAQRGCAIVLGIGDFNGHVGKWIEGYEDVHRGNGIGERKVEGKMLLEFCDEKELCMANTWFRRSFQLQHRLVVVDLVRKKVKRW